MRRADRRARGNSATRSAARRYRRARTSGSQTDRARSRPDRSQETGLQRTASAYHRRRERRARSVARRKSYRHWLVDRQDSGRTSRRGAPAAGQRSPNRRTAPLASRAGTARTAVGHLVERDLLLCQMVDRALESLDAEFERHNPRRRKSGIDFDPRMHRLKIVGRAEDQTLPPDMDDRDGVRRRHLHDPEQPIVGRQQRGRALDQDMHGP